MGRFSLPGAIRRTGSSNTACPVIQWGYETIREVPHGRILFPDPETAAALLHRAGRPEPADRAPCAGAAPAHRPAGAVYRQGPADPLCQVLTARRPLPAADPAGRAGLLSVAVPAFGLRIRGRAPPGLFHHPGRQPCGGGGGARSGRFCLRHLAQPAGGALDHLRISPAASW